MVKVFRDLYVDLTVKETMTYMKSPLEQAKPDYPDIDGDGNTTESMKKAAADKKSPLEQKLGIGDKLSAINQAFENWEGPFGSSSIYDEYKEDKKRQREDIRRKNMGLSKMKKTDYRGAPYWITVNAEGQEVNEDGSIKEDSIHNR